MKAFFTLFWRENAMTVTRSSWRTRPTHGTDGQPAPAVFRRQGEYWAVAYDGVALRVRDSKGLRCIAFLLHRPGVTVGAVQLLTAGQPAGRAQCGADARRARVTVTKRIRGAISLLTAQHASLGHHLGTCIKTGRGCAYIPDPVHPPGWSF